MDTIPDRVVNLEQARRRFGAQVDRLLPALWRGDPLADTHVDEPFPAFVARVSPPPWFDRDRVARAGRLLFRAGPLGGVVLGARSLVSGYCSPAGNKPLVLTGRLTGPGQSQRLAETGAFVNAVCLPGGLEAGAMGFVTAVRVRRMHAVVRRLAARDPRWDAAAWASPVNQHDLAATSLLFSQVFVDGLRALGVAVSEREAEDWLHLWRVVSDLMGVETALLPHTEPEARQLVDLIALTQGPPDDDARRLVRALLDAPGGVPWVAEGFCRGLLGDVVADGLALPNHSGRHVVRAIAALTRPVERLRRRSPHLDDALVRRGRAWWQASIAHSSQGRPLTWTPPETLVPPPSPA